MGLFDDEDDELDALLDAVKKYPSCIAELNEGIVQEIFNRCLATNDTPKKNISRSMLFSRTFGYKPDDEFVFSFDKSKLLANKQIINYLFGQLKSIHNKNKKMSIDEAFYNYSGKKWSNSKSSMLELLCLGCTIENPFIAPFNAENNSTSLASNLTKPTLSPKDPNFPAWWEEHKAEWEDRKKDNEEVVNDTKRLER